MLDLIISHGIDPGRTIVPATKDIFTNNLPDLSQLFCVSIKTNELDKINSNMGTIFSNPDNVRGSDTLFI